MKFQTSHQPVVKRPAGDRLARVSPEELINTHSEDENSRFGRSNEEYSKTKRFMGQPEHTKKAICRSSTHYVVLLIVVSEHISVCCKTLLCEYPRLLGRTLPLYFHLWRKQFSGKHL